MTDGTLRSSTTPEGRGVTILAAAFGKLENEARIEEILRFDSFKDNEAERHIETRGIVEETGQAQICTMQTQPKDSKNYSSQSCMVVDSWGYFPV
jgi:hypothetical protein